MGELDGRLGDEVGAPVKLGAKLPAPQLLYRFDDNDNDAEVSVMSTGGGGGGGGGGWCWWW